jgi:hypothetical protein
MRLRVYADFDLELTTDRRRNLLISRNWRARYNSGNEKTIAVELFIACKDRWGNDIGREIESVTTKAKE